MHINFWIFQIIIFILSYCIGKKRSQATAEPRGTETLEGGSGHDKPLCRPTGSASKSPADDATGKKTRIQG